MTPAVLDRPTIEVALSPPQYEVFTSDARFRVLIAGRRFGKTYLAVVDLLHAANERPGLLYWYTAPTEKNARQFAWPTFKAVIPPELIAHKNETLLTLDLLNGSRIQLVGRQNPNALRGGGLGRIVNDEFAVNAEGDKGQETWETVLSPMLADTDGDALFISTPRGYNWGYDFFLRGQNGNNPDWKSWQFTTLEGGRVSNKWLDSQRKLLPEKSFGQEYLATFEMFEGRVYDTFDRFTHVDPEVSDQGGDLYVGQDFNITPMASVIAVRVADQCHVLDALELPHTNTEEICEEVRRRYVDTGQRKPHEIVFCPDPTGKARKTSAPVGQTDFSIIKRYGFKISAPPKAPPVIDRENNTKAMLRTADGTVRVKIHPRAEALVRGLGSLTYKPSTKQRDKSSGLDHICDAFDYLLWSEFNVLAKRAIKVERFAR